MAATTSTNCRAIVEPSAIDLQLDEQQRDHNL
jgi:hypothetical protein